MSDAEILKRRSAASKKGAASRKRLTALRVALAGGPPIAAPARGSGPRGADQAMGFSPREIMARIRARETGH